MAFFQLKYFDIRSFLYLFNKPAALKWNRCDHQFLRFKNLLQKVFELIRQTLHLSDLVNNDQSGRRTNKWDSVKKIFKRFYINLVFPHSVRSFYMDMRKKSSFSTEADEFEPLSYAFFSYLFSIKSNRMKML